MTLEEMKTAFDAFKAETAASIAAIKADAEAEKTRLKTKIGELIGEKKKLKKRMMTEDDDDGEGEEDDTPPKSKKSADPDLARVQREHATALTEMQEKLAKAEQKAKEAAVKTALADALDNAKIDPRYRAAVEALLKGKFKIEVDEAGAVTFDGKAVSDSVAGWAKSEGGAFVAAPASGGSAAHNATPSGGGDPAKPRSKMSHAEKGAYIREHGQEAYYKLPA